MRVRGQEPRLLHLHMSPPLGQRQCQIDFKGVLYMQQDHQTQPSPMQDPQHMAAAMMHGASQMFDMQVTAMRALLIPISLLISLGMTQPS